jgi:arsenate reductase-like glutaredoxin family protein
MEVQLFGLRNDADTRKAERFFAERRVKVHFVDLKQRAIAPGEIRRWLARFGLQALVNTRARRFAELGLAGRGLTEERWIETFGREPTLLRLPLARCGQQLSVGHDESAWRAWLAAE